MLTVFLVWAASCYRLLYDKHLIIIFRYWSSFVNNKFSFLNMQSLVCTYCDETLTACHTQLLLQDETHTAVQSLASEDGMFKSL